MPLLSDAPDGELAARAAAGDSRAFDEIVARHGSFALRVAARLAPDGAAEDLAQEAMMRAWTQIGRFDPARARFTTWLYRIVVNLCIDHRRKRRPGQLPEDFDPPDPAPSAEQRIAAGQSDRALAQAIEALPARQRAALTLVYDEGLSGVEAARVLGLTAKAVERLLARGRAFLRTRLAPQDQVWGDEG